MNGLMIEFAQKAPVARRLYRNVRYPRLAIGTSLPAGQNTKKLQSSLLAFLQRKSNHRVTFKKFQVSLRGTLEMVIRCKSRATATELAAALREDSNFKVVRESAFGAADRFVTYLKRQNQLVMAKLDEQNMASNHRSSTQILSAPVYLISTIDL